MPTWLRCRSRGALEDLVFGPLAGRDDEDVIDAVTDGNADWCDRAAAASNRRSRAASVSRTSSDGARVSREGTRPRPEAVDPPRKLSAMPRPMRPSKCEVHKKSLGVQEQVKGMQQLADQSKPKKHGTIKPEPR